MSGHHGGMDMPLMLASDVLLSDKTTFSWPIVVFLGSVAVAVGESRLRLYIAGTEISELKKQNRALDAATAKAATVEKDREELKERVKALEAKTAMLDTSMAVQNATLGRIEQGIADLRDEIRQRQRQN